MVIESPVIAIPPIETPFTSLLPRPLPRPFRLDPSCVFYWDGIDKLSQRKVLDESGKNNHGAITGATYVPDGLFFDGLNDFVEIADNASLDITTALTVAVWINPEAIQSDANVNIIDKGTTEAYRIQFERAPLTRIEFSIGNGVQRRFWSPNNSITPGNWHFITMTFTGGTLTGYINSVEVNSQAGLANITTNNIDLIIGAFHGKNAEFFKGLIREVAIFNRGLSVSEIINFYLLGKARLGI